MTKDWTNPLRWAENTTAEYMFTNRIMTFIDPTNGQAYLNTAVRYEIDFSFEKSWQFYVPVLDWFAPFIWD